MAKHEELVAVYDCERWRSPDSNWSIGVVRGGLAVVGNSEPGDLLPGVEYKFIGVRDTHPRYGPQFKFKAFVQQQPHGREGMVSYLRRYITGIGERRANAIFDRYRHDTIAVLKNDPQRVAGDIPGITLEAAEKIAGQMKHGEKMQATRIDLLDLLEGTKLPVEKTIEHALKLWGIAAADRIKKDPFLLLQHKFPQIGFLSADRLYKHLGLPLTAMRRQVMACWYVVHSDMGGSTWLTAEDIARRMAGLIDSGLNAPESIAACVESGHLLREERQGAVFYADKGHGEAEIFVANQLRRLVA